jgi:hypothetical protein
MTRFILILLALVTLLGCQEPFLGDGEDDMTKRYSSWSASGTLRTLNTDDVVTLQADFEESGPYTLQFSVNAENVPTDVNPIAYIDWKVEGNWVHREITLISGTSISGTAEAVRVQIRDNDPGGIPGPTGIEYQVSVQVAKGTRPNIQQPAIYANQVNKNVAAAVMGVPGSTDIPVPQGIGVVSVFMSVGEANGVVITPQKVTATCIGSFGRTMQFDPTIPFWYPLPVTTSIIRVTNWNAFLVYTTVTYGIDG